MKDKLDLIQKLKHCPMGTKLYSPIIGECTFYTIEKRNNSIWVMSTSGHQFGFHSDGTYLAPGIPTNGELSLFPSYELRNWDAFLYAKEGDYITLSCKSRYQKELNSTCIIYVIKDGILNIENRSSYTLFGGALLEYIVKAHISTSEELSIYGNKPKPGDVITIEKDELSDIPAGTYYLCYLYYNNRNAEIFNGERIYPTTFNRIKLASSEKALKLKKKLRRDFNLMVTKGGRIVKCRLPKDSYFYTIDKDMHIRTIKDTYDFECNEIYRRGFYFGSIVYAEKIRNKIQNLENYEKFNYINKAIDRK